MKNKRRQEKTLEVFQFYLFLPSVDLRFSTDFKIIFHITIKFHKKSLSIFLPFEKINLKIYYF